ncbi:MAG: fluoride efflux transporter CrcB [bacterium]
MNGISLVHYLSVGIGGALGAMLRLWVSHSVHLYVSRDFPWGTLAVNYLGSFLIGTLFILVVENQQLDPAWRMVFVVGFLGALTTFSTFSLEALTLFQHKEPVRAIIYLIVSVFGCITLAWIGTILARLIK